MPDWDAGLYDGRHAFVWKAVASLLEMLAPKPAERILDLGCGTGHLTAAITAAGADVIGVDSSPAMLGAARREHPAVTFVEGDARRFDLGVFDAVFSNAALHWVRPPDEAARCIAAALKPGGRLVAELGGRGNVTAIRDAVARAAEEAGVPPPLPDWYFPSVGEYAALLEAAGLEVTWASLFARPTALEGADGLRGWLRQFAPAAQPLAGRVEEILGWRPGGAADYMRLRIVARHAP